MAGLFVALAVASALDRNWVGVPLSLGFAAAMVAGAFYHRRKLRMLANLPALTGPPLRVGDLDYEAPSRAAERVVLASVVVIVSTMVIGALYALIR